MDGRIWCDERGSERLLSAVQRVSQRAPMAAVEVDSLIVL